MHEFSIAQDILETVLAELAGLPGVRPIRVNLRIGELTAVVPDALEIGWESLSRGTPAEGAALSIENVPATAVCRTCGFTLSGLENLFSGCPRCGPATLEVLTGRELEIETLEIDDDEEDPSEQAGAFGQ